jgi:hypothetical protein
VAAAFDVTVVPCFTETREHCPLLLASARAAGHAATVGSGESQDIRLSQPRGKRKLLRMDDDEPWECSFQVRRCTVDVMVLKAGEFSRLACFRKRKVNYKLDQLLTTGFLQKEASPRGYKPYLKTNTNILRYEVTTSIGRGSHVP